MNERLTSFYISQERFAAGVHCAQGVEGRVDLESLVAAFCTGAGIVVGDSDDIDRFMAMQVRAKACERSSAFVKARRAAQYILGKISGNAL